MWRESSPRNPYRPVHWRWNRAVAATTTGPGLSRRRDDKWVQRAARVHLALQQYTASTDVDVISEADFDVYWAYELFRHRGEDEEIRRLTPHGIEARILARQSYKEIGEQMGLWPGVIEAYEKLFFDVTPKINAKDYIYFTVLGPSIYKGLRTRQYDLLWKLIGYMSGPVALEIVLRMTVNPSCPVDAEAGEAWVTDSVSSDLKLKALLAAKTVAVNDFTATHILTEWNKMVEIERAGGKGNTSEAIAKNVGAMISNFGFHLAGQVTVPPATADRPRDRAALEPYDALGVELRGDEAMALSLGLPGPDVAELVTLKFPDPVAKNLPALPAST